MLLTRRPDGSIEFQIATLREFREDWRKAPPHLRGQTSDGRPAIYRPASEGQEASYLALHPLTWDLCKRRLAELHVPVKKREKHCTACKTPMAMVRELTDLWIFRCPRCRGTEMFDKATIGGTIGAGETEQRLHIHGADLV